MRIIVLFRQGSADFRFVIGANIIEVQGTDGLGVPVWLPAKGGHMTRDHLLERALIKSCEVLTKLADDGNIYINIGKVG